MTIEIEEVVFYTSEEEDHNAKAALETPSKKASNRSVKLSNKLSTRRAASNLNDS